MAAASAGSLPPPVQQQQTHNATGRGGGVPPHPPPPPPHTGTITTAVATVQQPFLDQKPSSCQVDEETAVDGLTRGVVQQQHANNSPSQQPRSNPERQRNSSHKGNSGLHQHQSKAYQPGGVEEEEQVQDQEHEEEEELGEELEEEEEVEEEEPNQPNLVIGWKRVISNGDVVYLR